MKDRKSITQIARELRKNMTPAERKLWSVLRYRQLDGKKFLRQHPIIHKFDDEGPKFFVADFYCAESRLVVEVDGKVHEYQKEHDKTRDDIIRGRGLKVLRIKNEELRDMKRVVEKIRRYL